MLAIQRSFQELFLYREVLANMLARELKLKYKRTALGYVWSLLNPILQLTVLATVFSHIVRQGVRDYTLYLFSGLLFWNFFNATLLTSARCYLENENFIKKIYLPKLLFPVTKLCMRSIELCFSFVALTLIAFVLGLHFNWTVLLTPLALVLFCLFTLGIAIVVSVSTVFYRDVEYFVGVALQLLYFATPIMYPIGLLPEKYRFYIELNPLYSQIHLFQLLIYDGVMPSGLEWGRAILVSLLTFGFGMLWLLKTEDELVFRM